MDCLLEYTREALVELLDGMGHKAFRATQLQEWVWKHRATTFEQMSNLPPALRSELAARFCLRLYIRVSTRPIAIPSFA